MWVKYRRVEIYLHTSYRPSQLNYMLHGCKRVSFCENKKNEEIHTFFLTGLAGLMKVRETCY